MKIKNEELLMAVSFSRRILRDGRNAILFAAECRARYLRPSTLWDALNRADKSSS